MNAQSRTVKIYSIKNMPKFIDEGITTAIANKLNIDFGKYKYGFWNFSKTGVMKPQLVTLLILLPIKLVQSQP